RTSIYGRGSTRCLPPAPERRHLAPRDSTTIGGASDGLVHYLSKSGRGATSFPPVPLWSHTMPFRITSSGAEPATLDTPLLVIALAKNASLPAPLGALDESLGGAIGRSLSRRDFRGDRDELLHLTGTDAGPKRILLVGLGEPTDR